MKKQYIFGLIGLLAGLLVLLFPTFLDSNTVWLLNQGMIYAIIVLGLYFILGLTGQMSLAQAGFMGIGAYTSGVLTSKAATTIVTGNGSLRLGLDPWLGLLAAGVVATTVGILVGIPTLRLKGHYLAMATIGLGVIVGLLLLNWTELSGGPDGITNVPVFRLGGFIFDKVEKYYYIVLIITALLALAAWRVRYSRVGRSLLAIRENEMAAQAMGINTTFYKVMAFALSAGYGGLGGALFAHQPNVRYISPDTFVFAFSVTFLAMLVLGGSDSIFGAIFGAVFLNFLPEWLRGLPKQIKDSYLLIYGAGIMLSMIFLPVGVIGFIERWISSRFLHPALQPARPELVAQVGRPATYPTAGAGRVSADASQDNEVVLELKDLQKHFGGIKAVDGINMQVRQGEIHALIGPNGSGKTTALNVISGIYKPTGGQIVFMGHAIGGKPAHQLTGLGLARTFQNIRLFPELTALENVMVGQHVRSHVGLFGAVFPLPASRAEEKRIKEEALAALEFVGLLDKQASLAKNLAYGQQRRVEIARALCAKPMLLLLDEPAAGMNPSETEELLALLRQLRERGITLLLIEHDMNLVMSLSDQITVLNFGKEIADGVPQQIERNPAVIEAYLGAEVVNA